LLNFFSAEKADDIKEEKEEEKQAAEIEETEEEATVRQLVEAADLIAASVKDEDDGSSK
jgi:hypothetical protein